MKGIQFLVNDKGEKTSVLIDLEEYRELWEDFYDAIIALERAEEPRETLESVQQELIRSGKLSG
ncbi:hypothetical protein ISS30_05645 [bacterium]|nr:hypothetical protein [bacterium]